MKYPAIAMIALAAVACVPAAADATSVGKHHKLHHAAYHHHPASEAYGMYDPGGIQKPIGMWSSGNAAADGNNGNSMFGPNSASENAGGS